MPPAAPTMPKLPDPKKEKDQAGSAPAKVIVQAPADVRVTVNGQAAEMKSTEQAFATPDLRVGATYSYVFKAEAVRDGKTVTRTQEVFVRAGEEARVNFNDLAAGAESARVTLRLPDGARLYVDGTAFPLPATARTFETPKLEPGRTYSYTFRAELVRDGQTLTDTRRIDVEAGKQVTVEFRNLAVQAASR
jgi:uncharacterized protein (TIGR03000 family)